MPVYPGRVIIGSATPSRPSGPGRPHSRLVAALPCDQMRDFFMPESHILPAAPPPPPPRAAEAVTLKLDAKGQPETVTGDDFGETSPVHCRLADGTPGVLKLERPKDLCEAKRLEAWWAQQIVSSHVMRQLGCPTVTYREATAQHQGETLRGVACELADIRELSQDPGMISNVKNADQAILGAVVNAWLGDFDRIVKNENIWIDHEQKVLYGDYGCSGMDGVNALGVLPKVNRTLFAQLATPANLKAALDVVRGLSDERIAELVQGAAPQAPSAAPAVLKELTETLIANRDELRADPRWGMDLIGAGQPTNYAMPERIANAFLERLNQLHPGRCPDEVAREALVDVPGYAPQNGRDRQLVELQLANALHRREEGRGAGLELVPDCFYVWMQLAKKIFTVNESLQLGLGLKHREG